jgi:hypothetical protein
MAAGWSRRAGGELEFLLGRWCASTRTARGCGSSRPGPVVREHCTDYERGVNHGELQVRLEAGAPH